MSRARENRAQFAADAMCKRFKTRNDIPRIGLVLGTGWGDALKLENEQEMPFQQIPGFDGLPDLSGHARRVVFGTIDNQEVLALRGRIHLNEGHGKRIIEMVRLQTEMLFQMGVTKLIVTSAVGGLVPRFPVGSIAIVDSFISLMVPDMPMWGGEFKSPEDMLSEDLNADAMLACMEAGLHFGAGGATHIMLRGPFFEGRKNDKRILRDVYGADVVGMSMFPEACVASVYNIPVIGLGFVTNDAVEEHSHEENMARAKEQRVKLATLLTSLIRRIASVR